MLTILFAPLKIKLKNLTIRILICSLRILPRGGLWLRVLLINEETFKAKYHVVGLVEPHVPCGADPDLHAWASAQGYDSASNPAMVYANTNGNQGGEMILAAKHTFSLPVEDTILQMARNANNEIPRFSSLEVCFGKMSILVVVAYFWCSEGLSARNWAILHQVSMLIRQFKIPLIFSLISIWNQVTFGPVVSWMSMRLFFLFLMLTLRDLALRTF